MVTDAIIIWQLKILALISEQLIFTDKTLNLSESWFSVMFNLKKKSEARMTYQIIKQIQCIIKFKQIPIISVILCAYT